MTSQNGTSGAIRMALIDKPLQPNETRYMLAALLQDLAGSVVVTTRFGSIEKSLGDLTLDQTMSLLTSLGITLTATLSTTVDPTSAGAPSATTTETDSEISGDSIVSSSPSGEVSGEPVAHHLQFTTGMWMSDCPIKVGQVVMTNTKAGWWEVERVYKHSQEFSVNGPLFDAITVRRVIKWTDVIAFRDMNAEKVHYIHVTDAA